MESASEPIQSPRESLAGLGTLLNGVLSNPGSELSQGIVDAVREESPKLPSFAVLSAREGDLWNTFLSYDPPSGDYGGGYEIIMLGWSTTTFHQAHAAFRLGAEGLGEVAVANVRAAMEHAIYLSALVGSGNVEIILKSKAFRHIKGLKNLLAFVDSQTPSAFAGLANILESSMSGVDESGAPRWVENVQQICERLNTGSQIYENYRILSERMHPGMGSAIYPASFDEPDSGGSRSIDPTGDVNTPSFLVRHTLWLAIGACAWAGWAADQLFATDHFGPLLAEFADELGFVPIFNTPQLEEEI